MGRASVILFNFCCVTLLYVLYSIQHFSFSNMSYLQPEILRCAQNDKL